MNREIFKKMKTKPGMSATAFNAPQEYPQNDQELQWNSAKTFDFVHLFVQSKAEFEEHFAKASAAVNPGGLLWLSSPKAAGKQKYDINRDSLWDLVLPRGWHPVSQVALSDSWSAVRLRENDPDTEYARPNANKKPKA